MKLAISLFMIMTVTGIFSALLVSDEQTGAFDRSQEKEEVCEVAQGDGMIVAIRRFADQVVCWAKEVVKFFTKIWDGIRFIYSLITFDLPGAPWYVRTIVTTFYTVSTVLIVVSIARGVKAG